VAALRDAGLTLNPRLQLEGDYTEQSGWKAGQALVGHLGQFDALFCSNDQMAMGALQSLQDSGASVPRDIRLIGYDDHPLSLYTQPALTTVGADFVNVGREMALRLLRILDDEAVEPAHLVLPTRLVVRTSCGCEATPTPH